MRGFFITGTDTGVGKTEVAASLASMFYQKGYKIGVMKPFATGVKDICKDARVLKIASKSDDPIEIINPISFKLPLAPLVAGRLEKKQINFYAIVDKFRRLRKLNDILIVEGIGGVMVPIYEEKRKTFYVIDMIKKFNLPVILVSRPNLGTINHTLMAVKILQDRKIKIAGIIINHISKIKNDLSVDTNPEIIERLSRVSVLGIMPYNKDRSKRRIIWLKEIEY